MGARSGGILGTGGVVTPAQVQKSNIKSFQSLEKTLMGGRTDGHTIVDRMSSVAKKHMTAKQVGALQDKAARRAAMAKSRMDNIWNKTSAEYFQQKRLYSGFTGLAKKLNTIRSGK